MRLLRQLLLVFIVLGALGGLLMLFTYDIVKLEWVSFMEIQPSFQPMEQPLAPPARSIPITGPAMIPNVGAPDNPVASDEVSVQRGGQLFQIHCQMCHGAAGTGNGPIATFLQVKKPADLTAALVQDRPDAALFQTISNGMPGTMPALNENLTMRERWDVVNFLRTLRARP